MVSEVSVPNNERACIRIQPPLGNGGLPEGMAVSDSSLSALASLLSRKSTNIKRVNRWKATIPHPLYAKLSCRHPITLILTITPGSRYWFMYLVMQMRKEGTRWLKSPARVTTAIDGRATMEPGSLNTKQVLLTTGYGEDRWGGKVWGIGLGWGREVSSLTQVRGYQREPNGAERQHGVKSSLLYYRRLCFSWSSGWGLSRRKSINQWYACLKY